MSDKTVGRILPRKVLFVFDLDSTEFSAKLQLPVLDDLLDLGEALPVWCWCVDFFRALPETTLGTLAEVYLCPEDRDAGLPGAAAKVRRESRL